jgi:hypothetical protein
VSGGLKKPHSGFFNPLPVFAGISNFLINQRFHCSNINFELVCVLGTTHPKAPSRKPSLKTGLENKMVSTIHTGQLLIIVIILSLV